jgi:hypothetical protein
MMFYVKESAFGSSKQKNYKSTKESKCPNNIIFFINYGFGKMP